MGIKLPSSLLLPTCLAAARTQQTGTGQNASSTPLAAPAGASARVLQNNVRKYVTHVAPAVQFSPNVWYRPGMNLDLGYSRAAVNDKKDIAILGVYELMILCVLGVHALCYGPCP